MTTPADLELAHCWFAVDRVASDPATTAWKREARFHQSEWRRRHSLPIGSHPYRGGPDATPVGSRLELAFAKRAVADGRMANLVTDRARSAALARVARPERHQMLNEDRLWADLLSSMPLCFNLFGGLAGEDAAPHAARAVHAWWPDAPRGHTQLLLEHSPGRRDDAFLGNRTSFDAMFQIDVDASSRAVIAVETKYHEHALAPTTRAAKASARHLEVSERSGAFRDGWQRRVVGTELHQIWLDHLLLLSMLQHPSRVWKWGRFVLAYPARNPSFARAAAAYRDALRDPSTFEARPLDDLVDTPNALDAPTVAALRDRYLFRGPAEPRSAAVSAR